MTNRDTLRQRLAEMRALEKGWYDGSGEPVPPPVIAWVEEWLSRDDEDFDGWWMFPCEEGGVSLERQLSDGALMFEDSVRVYAERITHFRGTRRRDGAGAWRWSVWMEHALAAPHECFELDAEPLLSEAP